VWTPNTCPNYVADPQARDMKQSVITHTAVKSVNYIWTTA